MINYSSFVVFANKINRQTPITSECVEHHNIRMCFSQKNKTYKMGFGERDRERERQRQIDRERDRDR